MSGWLSPERRRLFLLLLIPILTLLGTGIATLHNGYLMYHKGDLRYYLAASSLLLSGQMPYRDYQFAYPPLSLVPFVLPHLAAIGGHSGFALYTRAFLVESCVWSVGVSLLLARLTSRWTFPLNPEAALCCYALLVLIFAGLLPWRFDLFPALLTLASFYCLLQKKPFLAGVWLGFAVAAKLYSIVLLPVFALYLLTLGRQRDTAFLACGGLGAMALCVVPFLRIPLSTFLTFLTFHQQRGLEIESLGAGVLMIAHAEGWTNAKMVTNYGACNLSSASAPAIIHCLPVIFLVLFGLTLAGGRRAFRLDIARSGSIQPETLTRCTLAALLVFIAANKVFSTSYVIWLLPFAPLLRPREAFQMLILFALTITIYPYNFGELLTMHPVGIWLLNIRNVFLLSLLYQLARPAGEPLSLPRLSPAPSRMAEV